MPTAPSEEVVLTWFDDLSNWNRWGDDDRLGTLNHLTPAEAGRRRRPRARRRLGLVQLGHPHRPPAGRHRREPALHALDRARPGRRGPPRPAGRRPRRRRPGVHRHGVPRPRRDPPRLAGPHLLGRQDVRRRRRPRWSPTARARSMHDVLAVVRGRHHPRRAARHRQAARRRRPRRRRPRLPRGPRAPPSRPPASGSSPATCC